MLALALAALLGGVAAESGGFGARIGGADLYGAFLSKYRYAAAAFRAARLPLWNPYEFCGWPLHGTAQGAVFYPPVVAVNMVLPAGAALQVLYHLHLAALLLFTLFYLRRAGVGPIAGSIGASLFAASVFNGFAGAGRDHPSFIFSLTYLPAILLAWESLCDGKRWAGALVAMGLGLQWVAGYPGFAMVTALLLSVVAVLGHTPVGRGRRLLLAGACVALGAVLGAVQVLPLVETAAQSGRATSPPGRYLFMVLGFGHLLALLVQRYGTGGVFFLLLGTLTRGWQRRAWIACLVWATFATNRPLGYLYHVYPFSGVRNAYEWHHLGPFFAGCLAAVGVQRLRRQGSGPHQWLAPMIGATLAFGAVAFGAGLQTAGAAGLCALASIEPVRRRGGWAVPVALVALHVAVVMYSVGTVGGWPAPDVDALARRVAVLRRLHGLLPGAPRVVSGPEIRAGLMLRARLPSPAGHEPALAPRRMGRINAHLGIDLLAFARRERAVWQVLERKTWSRLAANPGLAAAVGIGLAALPPEQAKPLREAGYRPVARLPGGDVVLYKPAVPRFHLVHKVQRTADEEESFRAVTAPGFDPWTVVVLETEPPFEIGGASTAGAGDTVRVLGGTPEHVRLRVFAVAPALLVISDAYFPGWAARVDGSPVPLLRANYAFRAVALRAGRHEVELDYRPRSFRLGAAASGAGLVLILGWLVVGVWRRPVADTPEPG